MAANLVIVESPAKARTIQPVLGSRYAVKASLGHVRDLPKRKIGVDVKQTSLKSNQDFPQDYFLSRPFTNLLPNLMFRKKFSASKTLNIFYRSSANVPSAKIAP